MSNSFIIIIIIINNDGFGVIKAIYQADRVFGAALAKTKIS